MQNNEILVLVNDDGIRPAGRQDECFYCNQKVGMPHSCDCVCLLHKARVKIEIESDLWVWGHNTSSIQYQLDYKHYAQTTVLKQLLELAKEANLDVENTDATFSVIKVYDDLIRGEEIDSDESEVARYKSVLKDTASVLDTILKDAELRASDDGFQTLFNLKNKLTQALEKASQ